MLSVKTGIKRSYTPEETAVYVSATLTILWELNLRFSKMGP